MQVERVGFAPVKGTRHTAYDEVVLDEHGPVGDRELCLVDVERRHVLRTVQNHALVAVRTRRDGDSLTAVLPSGETAAGPLTPSGESVECEYWGRPVPLALLEAPGPGPLAELFSDHLGRPVRLAAAPRGGVVYGDQVTLVSTASLRSLAEHAGEPRLAGESARFRPTMVLDLGDEPHREDTWSGREVGVGDARLRIGDPVPRCAVVDLHPETGVKDARVLKALAGYRPRDAATGDLLFAVYATVVSPGKVRPGDPVRL